MAEGTTITGFYSYVVCITVSTCMSQTVANVAIGGRTLSKKFGRNFRGIMNLRGVLGLGKCKR